VNGLNEHQVTDIDKPLDR